MLLLILVTIPTISKVQDQCCQLYLTNMSSALIVPSCTCVPLSWHTEISICNWIATCRDSWRQCYPFIFFAELPSVIRLYIYQTSHNVGTWCIACLHTHLLCYPWLCPSFYLSCIKSGLIYEHFEQLPFPVYKFLIVQVTYKQEAFQTNTLSSNNLPSARTLMLACMYSMYSMYS